MKQLRLWSAEEVREEKPQWDRLPGRSREQVVVQLVRLVVEAMVSTASRAAQGRKEKR
jgi:hypothetical protein